MVSTGTVSRMIFRSKSLFRLIRKKNLLNMLLDGRFGVQPQFHLAVLIKRQHTEAGKPIPFSSVFDMRTEAGFIHDFQERRRRLFRLGKPEDEAINYHPDMEDQVQGSNGSGDRLLAKIDKENLGKLIGGPDGNWLSGLIDPTGKLSGLDPMDAKTII